MPHPLADSQASRAAEEAIAPPPGLADNVKRKLDKPFTDLSSSTKAASPEVLAADVKLAHHPGEAVVKVTEVHDPTVVKPAPPLESAGSPSLAAGLREKAGKQAHSLALFKAGQPAEIAAVTGERAAEAVSTPTSIYPAKVSDSFWGKLPGWTSLAAAVLGGCASFAFLVWGISSLSSAGATRQVSL